MIDSWEFAKLVRDSGMLDDSLTATDVDLVFLKLKERQEKRITYEQFLVGLAMIAAKRGEETTKVEAAVAQCDGPDLHGTRARFNKMHDDKAYYTGSAFAFHVT